MELKARAHAISSVGNYQRFCSIFFPFIQQVRIVRNLLVLRNIDLLERQNKMKVAETIHKIDKSSRK